MNEMLSAVFADRGHRPSRPAPAIRSHLHVQSDAVPGIAIAIFDELSAVEDLWRRFEPVADGTVFQTFDYLAAWFRYVGAKDDTRPAVVVLQSDTDVLAVLPLGVYADAAFRRLAWLGQDLGDYLGPLLAPEFAQSVSSERFLALWQEILRLLRSHPRLTFDVVTLCKMPGRIGGQVNPFMAQPAARHPSDGFLLTLQPPWEDFYIARRSAKARRQDKSKRARLGETGDVRMVNAQGEKEIAATIDDLLSQKSAVFARKGILDPFQRPGYREFFLHLALDARTRDLLHVSRLDVDGQPAAINLGIEYRGRYSLCLVSYDEKFARFSPGAIHLNELLHRAIERGLLEFDFLVGFQRLKQEWADRRIELYDHVAGVTPRGVLIAAALRGLARAKRTVKTSPGLWNAFLRLREATGPLRGLVQRRRR